MNKYVVIAIILIVGYIAGARYPGIALRVGVA